MKGGEFKNVSVTNLNEEKKVSAKGKEYSKYNLKLNNMPFSFTSYNLPKDITQGEEILSFDRFFAVFQNKEFMADIEIDFVPNNYNGQDSKKENVVGIHIIPIF